MSPVFADTFYFLAILNDRDECHERAVTLSNSLRRPIVTTAWVFTELADGLADTPGRTLFQPFMASFRTDPRALIIPAAEDLFDRGASLYDDRPDKEWSLTDCISFVVMREMSIATALTADRHFEQAGFSALLKMT